MVEIAHRQLVGGSVQPEAQRKGKTPVAVAAEYLEVLGGRSQEVHLTVTIQVRGPDELQREAEQRGRLGDKTTRLVISKNRQGVIHFVRVT